jgi:hypothetical protein
VTSAQKELIFLWLLITTNQAKFNPAGGDPAKTILNNIAADFNAVKPGAWNWDNLTPATAMNIVADAVNNGNSYDTAITNFQGNNGVWPAAVGVDHPTVAELMSLLGLPAV